MKKSALTGLIILFTICLYAQEWTTPAYRIGEKYPGYVIKTDGTKIEGFLEAQTRGSIDGTGFSNQNRVVFFSDPKDRKTKITYKPEDLKEYMIADKLYKTMSYSGGLMAKPLRFLLVKISGQIGLYVWYDHNGYEANRTPIYTDKIIIQKGDEKPVEFSNFALSFAKKMSEMVSDYPELSKKVLDKEAGYGMASYEKVIIEYNTWFKEKNK